MSKELERAYLAALKAGAARNRGRGKRVPAYLREATKTSALARAKINLNYPKSMAFSGVAKRYEIGKEPDLSPDADELLLYLDNDEPTYRQVQSVQKNLAKKMRDGLYSHKLAEKGWTHAADFASARYAKEIGRDGIEVPNRGSGSYAHSAPLRREVARYLAWRFVKDAQSGEHDKETWTS